MIPADAIPAEQLLIISSIPPAVAAAWVTSDARRRGMAAADALLWGLGTFLVLIVFLPWYLFHRAKNITPLPPRPTAHCRYCNAPVEGDGFYCQHCGKQLKGIDTGRT